MLPCGFIHAALQSDWFPSCIHQLFLLLQVAGGVRLFKQCNTEQNQSAPTVAASTSALQFEHLPLKVNTLSEEHE